MVRKHRFHLVRDYPHLAPLVVLAKAFVGFWIVIAFGTVGYRVIEGWPTLDCFYMTMITLTTIGFGEIYPLSPQGRIFTVIIIFLGFGIVGYSALTGVRFFIEGEFIYDLPQHFKDFAQAGFIGPAPMSIFFYGILLILAVILLHFAGFGR